MRGTTCLVTALVVASALPALAQEIELRAYANAPTGMNFVALGYGYQTGGVLFDPSLPIEDVRAEIHSGFLRYTRTFGLLGKAAKLKASLPVSSGDWRGVVGGDERERETSGLGDTRVTLEVDLLGAPALAPRDFAGYRQTTIVGASLSVIAPTGEYDPSKLINLGSNRWSFRGEVGVSHALGRFILEGTAGLWYFTENDDFFGHKRLEQDPFYSLNVGAIYSVRPGLWVGVGVARGQGGSTSVEGVQGDTEQRNWRFSVVCTYPVSRRQGLSLTAGTGKSEAAGSDFDQYALAYQFAWGG